jgi:hypothetical protein
MQNTLKISLASAIAAAALVALPASADPIAGLFNTGADNLAVGQIDTHYTFASLGGTATGTPMNTGTYGAVADPSQFPFGYWLSNTATSQWLAPTADAGSSYDPSVDGYYSWTLSFTLGSNYNTASFAGQWAADNGGYVELNGNILAGSQISAPGGWGFNHWTTFSADSGFQDGTNTLTFVVDNWAQNGGNPTGLQVQFTDSSVAAVPEPETYALLLSGLGLMGFVARRRKSPAV